MNVVHTEGREIGQIYVPFVNWALAAATVAAVLIFGSSDALAGAYGIAVSLLMVITTLMATFVALHWKHNPLIVYSVNGSLLALDLLFFASTATKLFDGGWFPLLIAFVIAFLMLTWRKGEEVMNAYRVELRERVQDFLDHIKRDPPYRLPGTAIVLGRLAKGVPLALSHNVSCNQVLHEHVMFLAVTTTETPYVPDEDRVAVTPISAGLERLVVRYGFMEQPNVPDALAAAAARGLMPDISGSVYYTGHETIIPSGRRAGLPRWREALFAFMHHNAQRPGAYFKIPTARIMEIGVEFEI
jgi:KUP system potassium uptake protein